MAYVKATPFKPQFDDSNGNLLASGTMEFYVWDTATPTAVYTDSAGAGSATTVTLDARGEPTNDIFYDTAVIYKAILKDAAGATIDTLGPIYPPLSSAWVSTVTDVRYGRVFQTVAAAKAATDLVDTQAVFILGYHAANEGGGAYQYNSASAATANNGTILALDTLPGRLLHTRTTPVTVHTYGAKGDGVTSDSTAFSATAANEKYVNIPKPASSYLLSTSVTGFTSNTVVKGEGAASQIDVNVTGFGFEANGISDFVVEDLYFNIIGGSGAVRTQNTGVASTKKITYRNLIVDAGTTSSGGLVVQDNNTGSSTIKINDVLIDNCIVKNTSGGTSTAKGIILGSNFSGKRAERYTVKNTTVELFENGIDFFQVGKLDDVTIENCKILNNLHYGIRGYHSNNAVYINNLFDGNEVGLWDNNTNEPSTVCNNTFRNNTVVGMFTENTDKGVINGNKFYSNGTDQGGGVFLGGGLWLAGGRNTSVVGNTIIGNIGFGLNTDRSAVLTGASGQVYENNNKTFLIDITISGNTISENSTNGVELEGVQKSSLIIANTITRNGQGSANPAATSTYADIAVSLDTGAANNRMVNIKSNSFGNPTGSTGSGLDGKSQYGVLVNGSAASQLIIDSNSFNNLEVVASSSGGVKIFKNNSVIDCETIALTAGERFEGNNTFYGGTLDGSGGVNVDTISTAQGVNTVPNFSLVLTAQAAASAANSSLFIDSADSKLKWKDGGGTTNVLY